MYVRCFTIRTNAILMISPSASRRVSRPAGECCSHLPLNKIHLVGRGHIAPRSESKAAEEENQSRSSDGPDLFYGAGSGVGLGNIGSGNDGVTKV